MDTTVVCDCLKKWCGLGVSVASLLLLLSCPGEDMDCHDLGSIAEVPDLMVLTPKQETYNSGDVLTLTVNIPSNNDYFGNEINLFQTTQDQSATIIVNSGLYTDNILNFVKGSQGEYVNWFNMPYNSQTERYELEIQITLNRIGNYFIVNDDSVYIKGDNYCNRFRIDTNILWDESGPGIIEFTVTE